MRHLILLSLVLWLSACNITISGQHIMARYGDGQQALQIEMTDFEIVIPVQGAYMPQPAAHQVEVMQQ